MNNTIVWHKVTDGDLPNNLHYVWTNVGDNKIRWLSNDGSEKLNVYAWKEIVFPKEVKENEN